MVRTRREQAQADAIANAWINAAAVAAAVVIVVAVLFGGRK
jgi:hypothetical protein